MNISEWEARHSSLWPLHESIVDRGRAWRSSDIYGQNCQLATALRDLGLAAGDRVAIALPNCRELYVACGAVWAAGGIVVVIGVDTSSNILTLLRHCEPTILIATHQVHEAVPETESIRTRIVINAGPTLSAQFLSFDKLIACSKAIAEPVRREATDIAQLCYTSGATGVPRGVMYSHSGLVSYYEARRATAPPDEIGIQLMALPSTAFGGRFIGMRVTAPVTFVLLDRFEPEQVLAAIERYRVDSMPMLPAMAERLLAHVATRQYDCTSLRTLNISGAHVSRSLVERIKARLRSGAPSGAGENLISMGARTDGVDKVDQSPLNVIVHYGLTESGGGFASTADGGDGVVGKASAEAQILIVDENGEALQPNQVGAILVKTPYAASGYWRDPEATASVFRDGFVRTGDLGFLNSSMEITVLGRADELVIQGGQNIYPEEIGRALRTINGIADCAVVGLADDLLGEIAVACIVPRRGVNLTENEIRSACRKALPSRKQPARIVFMEAIPRGSVGKIRLLDLRTAASRAIDAGIFRQPPFDGGNKLNANECMAAIARIVESELRSLIVPEMAEVREDTLFGELGLDSVGAVEMSYGLSRSFRRRLSPTLIYSHPTVASLSAKIGEILSEGRSRDAMHYEANAER
jgi:acyl-CoA synthetase (AMP-forming)/AMP-acid ligase II/acyl carrier protein